MGRIPFEPHHDLGTYIPDHFSHRDLVRELRIEAPHARQGLIVPDVFWTKVEASYLSDPRMFLRQHECSMLDYIVRHDHLPADPDPANHDRVIATNRLLPDTGDIVAADLDRPADLDRLA